MMILIAFLTYLLGSLFHDLYTEDLELYSLSKAQAIFEYSLRMCEWISLKIFLAIMIIGGLLKIRREGFSLTRIVIPVLGSFLCISLIWNTSSSYESIKQLRIISAKAQENSNAQLKKFETKLAELDRREKTHEMMHFLAKYRYRVDGTKITYPNEAGEPVVFEPSKEEHDAFNLEIQARAFYARAEKSLKFEFYIWLFFLTGCNIAGLTIPVARKRGLPVS